jgi:hypothetical protein
MTRRIAVLLASILCAAGLLGSVHPARAAGYWTCRDGAWVGVDAPRHAKPLRRCGAAPSLPTTESACRAAGGRWGRAGLFPRPICTLPTRDGGRVCGDGGECEGTCLFDTTGDRSTMFAAPPRGPVTGVCTRARPVFGCMIEVTRGRIGRRICRD